MFQSQKALEKWLSSANEQENPLDGNQKNWTQPVFVETAQELISRMNDKRSIVFNAHQGKLFGSQWLNAVACDTLGLKLDDQQLGFQLVFASGPTFASCIRATVVIDLKGTDYMFFLAPSVLVASHVMVLSNLS